MPNDSAGHTCAFDVIAFDIDHMGHVNNTVGADEKCALVAGPVEGEMKPQGFSIPSRMGC